MSIGQCSSRVCIFIQKYRCQSGIFHSISNQRCTQIQQRILLLKCNKTRRTSQKSLANKLKYFNEQFLINNYWHHIYYIFQNKNVHSDRYKYTILQLFLQGNFHLKRIYSNEAHIMANYYSYHKNCINLNLRQNKRNTLVSRTLTNG